MTAFTDDLDNDVEVLAEHHDVTPVQVAKAAFAQVPDHVRLPLLLAMLESLPDGLRRALDRPVAEVASAIEPSAKLPLAKALFRSIPSQQEEPLSPHTGLPQKLRGAIHALTRNYPANLVVDAAMLEMPEDRRAAVARCFLPVEPKREVRRYELIDAENGDVLWEGDEPFQPMKFDYVAADGSVRGYQREGHMAFEFGPGAEGITSRTYFRSLESLAEESEQEKKAQRERLAAFTAEKETPKTGLYTVVDVGSGEELGMIVKPETSIRILDGKTGQPVSYTFVRVELEYDFRESETAAPRKLALYRKVTAG